MFRLLWKCVLVTLLLVSAANVPAADTPLQVGKDLAGAFRPYNVTGAYAGKFHCPITEHSYEPGMLVFVRNFNEPDALAAVRPLLTLIDDRIDKNFTRNRMNGFAVFYSDALPDVSGTAAAAEANAKNDDLREAFAKQLADLANADPKLKHVVLALDDKNDLKKYGLDESKFVTVVLYKRLQVVGVHALAKNELNPEKIDAINKNITDKLGATR